MADPLSDNEILELLEIDLEVEAIAEILTAHGVEPSAPLVAALWEFAEDLRNVRSDG